MNDADNPENGEMSDVYKRALQLQAQGPDEFPFGYYLHRAREEDADARDPAND